MQARLSAEKLSAKVFQAFCLIFPHTLRSFCGPNCHICVTEGKAGDLLKTLEELSREKDGI
jgi:hypothetical protein